MVLILSPQLPVVLSQLEVPWSLVSMDSTRDLLMWPLSQLLPEALSPLVVPVMPALLVMVLYLLSQLLPEALSPLVVPLFPVCWGMEALSPLHQVVLSPLEVP